MRLSARKHSSQIVWFSSLLLALVLLPFSRLADATALQLNPVSLSFPTPQSGYVLTLYDCATKTCAEMRSTGDAGSSWGTVPIPRQLEQGLGLAAWGTYGATYATLSVHFADASNGWIYGTVPAPVTPTTASPNWVNRLWSTHDGGQTWRPIRLGPLSLSGGVVQMASHGDVTYLFGTSPQNDRASLLSTRSRSDHWKVDSNSFTGIPAGGTQLEGAFTFAGTNGWFVAGNDRGFTASERLLDNGSWGAWNGFSLDRFDPSFTPLGAVGNRVLLAEGESAGYVYPPASTVPRGWNNGATWLFISYNAGKTFEPLRQLSNSYHGSYSTVPGLPAVPGPGTILLQKSSRSNSNRLVRSSNWGRSWRVVLDHPVTQVLFTSRTTGFAIVQHGSSPTTFSLYRTNDSGTDWFIVST
jgi:hypothetical protein